MIVSKFVLAGIISACSLGIMTSNAAAQTNMPAKEKKECEVMVNNGVAGGLCGRTKMSVQMSPVDEYKKCIAHVSTIWPQCAPYLKGEVVEEDVIGVNGQPRKLVRLKTMDLW